MKVGKKRHIQGVTLIEMLLVMVIVSMIIMMGVGYFQQQALTSRIDRSAVQMQQILNAGLSYYVLNGRWPTPPGSQQFLDSSPLVVNNYLPAGINSPWGTPYYIGATTPVTSGPIKTPSNFFVLTFLPAMTNRVAISQILVGKLPMAYTATTTVGFPPPAAACTATSGSCTIIAAVNVPGQNLNNASAINYAGLYHHGGCVPAPQCPVDPAGVPMTPQIIVVPASVSGLYDNNNLTNVYPISSFTAYARGTSTGNPAPSASPAVCTGYAVNPASPPCGNPTDPVGTVYWRACLQVVTEKGDVSTNNPAWGQNVTIAAFTRCAITNEPSGSNFSVWSR